MQQDIKDVIVAGVKSPLNEYNTAFKTLTEIGRNLEKTLENDTELMIEIRKRFDNLSAAVELEFEGTAVFEQEIKKTKDMLVDSIARVHDSLSVSNQVTQDLEFISKYFDEIHANGVALDDLIKNINLVSDSIEVASRNAGITAFHAGHQGRGFEVIAREMTTLVKSVQQPSEMIPDVAKTIVKQAVALGHDLLKISNTMYDLKRINTKFSTIAEDLLALIPVIEDGIHRIAITVESQKSLHRILSEENERFGQWLSDIYDTARSSAVLEIALEAQFRRINNIREKLMSACDNSSFTPIFSEFRIALDNTIRSNDRILHEMRGQDITQLDAQSSERSILQLVSETNQLSEIMGSIAKEIKTWVKINDQANDALTKGLDFYAEVTTLLSDLQNKLSDVNKNASMIENPLHDLKKITERSKILGLYAGIESARSGEHATALGLVTDEIKDLAERTSTFVGKIGEVASDMAKNLEQLFDSLTKCVKDVQEGITSLESAQSILNNNKNVLMNLEHLTKEMIDSTVHMTTHCNDLTERIRTLNTDYSRIRKGFSDYTMTVTNNIQVSQRIQKIMSEYGGEVAAIKRTPRTVVYRRSVEPIILDPANKTDARSHELIEQLFVGLFTFDSSNQLVPGIAESFSVSKDGLIWDFVLKKGVVFHNGRKVTAQHVSDMMKRVRQGPNMNFIDYVDSVVVKDDLHIRFILKFPYLPFLANLACGACDITPPRFDPGSPIGCGPYTLAAWNKGQDIHLEVFKDFFDGPPPVDHIIVKFIPDSKEAIRRFQLGEIDLMQVSADMLSELDPAEIVAGPILSTQYLGINVALDTPFKNKKVRQAMNCVIDKEQYARSAMEGQAVPGYGVFPPGMYVYDKDLVGYLYDCDRARALMKEAGYGNGLDGTFLIDIRDSPVARKRAQFICSALAEIGIALKINPMSWKDFLERGYRGESLLCMKSWVSDNGDPDNFLYPLFHSRSFGRAGNSSWYENLDVDKGIEKARSERNTKKRCALYRELERKIVDDAPWIFLTHGVDTYAVKSNIGGFRVDPFGIVRFRYLWGI